MSQEPAYSQALDQNKNRQAHPNRQMLGAETGREVSGQDSRLLEPLSEMAFQGICPGRLLNTYID